MRRLLLSLIVAGAVVLNVTAVLADSSLPPPTNIRITSQFRIQNEEQVWICPTDPDIVIANWRDFRLSYRQIGVGRSTDGGNTWTDSLIAKDMQFFTFDSRQSDPVLTVDAQGNFYMGCLDYDDVGFTGRSLIVFYKSTDKGLTWTGPVPNFTAIDNTIFEDKEFITVDRTGGTYDGNLYCVWARFPADLSSEPNRIMFVRSTDGAASFEDTMVVGPPLSSTGCGDYSAGQFAAPVVASNGDVHLFWIGADLDSGSVCSGENVFTHVVSTDGGQTFSDPENIMVVSGYQNASGGIQTYSGPATDADISGGPFDGNIYIAYTNMGDDDVPYNTTDVDFVRSTDNGLTWSAPMRINDDTNSYNIDNFHPWLVVNEEGIIFVIFYDQRYGDTLYYDFDCIAAYSFDGGETFTSNHRVSDVSSSPDDLSSATYRGDGEWPADPYNFDDPVRALAPQAGRIAEYIGVSANHDKVVAVWTDTRHGDQEVYTANWTLPMLEPRLYLPSDSAVLMPSPLSIDFQWATSWKIDDDRYRLEMSTDPTFGTGLFTYVLDSAVIRDFSESLPDGFYYWRVKTFNTAETDSSGYSETRTFWIDNTPPDPPLLVSPADESEIDLATPEFTWNHTPSATGTPEYYTLTISSDSTFPPEPGSVVYNLLDSVAFTPPDPLPDDSTRYFWFVEARDAFGYGNATSSDTFAVTYNSPCCTGRTGNVDLSGVFPTDVDSSDLGALVNYLFSPPGSVILPCTEEADVDAQGGPNPVDSSDLGQLVAFLFAQPPGSVALPDCP